MNFNDYTTTYETVYGYVRGNIAARAILNDALTAYNLANQYLRDGNDKEAEFQIGVYKDEMRRVQRFVLLHFDVTENVAHHILVDIARELIGR